MKKILRIIVSIGAVVVLYFVWQSGIISKNLNIEDIKKNVQEITNKPEERKFPLLQGLKKADYKWEYKGKNYELSLDLYDSVYQFYAQSPKEYSYYGNLPQNWEEDYYGMFLKSDPSDKTISDLASKIKDLAKKNKLSFDEEMELALSFVQTIPYDEEKAKNIEQNVKEEKPNYPYEVLYEDKGVCSGKSFLADELIRELGYGTALFEYKDQKHIAIGIECPKEFSTYSSGYCYAETTKPGHKIGIVPDIEAGTNAAVEKKTIENFGLSQENQQNTTKLGNVQIYQKKEGKSYSLVADTFKTKDRIDFLEKSIGSEKDGLVVLKNKIEQAGKAIDNLTSQMNQLKKDKKIEAYNSSVPGYNQSVNIYKGEVSEYNKKVEAYNKMVAEYNSLIKAFYN